MPADKDKSNCQFCNKKGLLILPLRYAAVLGPNAKKWIPPMPVGLGANVTDIQLDNGTYAPRFMRQGYLYVLINRTDPVSKKSSSSWEAYLASDNGYFSKFVANKPPSVAEEFNCTGSACQMNASRIAISNVAEVTKIYMLFSPTGLTAERLELFRKDPAARVAKGQLQSFNPAAWVANQARQDHSLNPAQLKVHIPELIVHDQGDASLISNMGVMLQEQLFPAMMDSFRGRKVRSANERAFTDRFTILPGEMKKEKSVAFVLYDHIGITQELNNYRNSAGEPLREYLAAVDSEQVSNLRKFNVRQAIEDTKAAYMQRSISTKKRYMGWMRPPVDVMKLIDERDKARAGPIGMQFHADRLDKRILAGLEENAKIKIVFAHENPEETWEQYYGCEVNPREMESVRTSVAKLASDGKEVALARYKDHVRWITSPRLVEAFGMFDNTNPNSGYCFTDEYMLCTDGMFGVTQNVPLLHEWLNASKIGRENLFLRAALFNQLALTVEARKAFADAKSQVAAVEKINDIASAPWLKAAKSLISTGKSIDSGWDEWLRDKNIIAIHKGKREWEIKRLSSFHYSAEGRFFRMVASWSQAIASKPGKMDKGIAAVVSMLIFSKLGGLSEVIGIEEYYGKVPKVVADQVAVVQGEAQKKRSTAKARLKEYNKMLAKKAKDAAAKIDDAVLKEAARHKAAADLAHLEAQKLDTMASDLIQDEQEKVKRKIIVTLEDIGQGKRPEVNNFRQARLGCLLLSIEALSLTLKLQDENETPRLRAERIASYLSITSLFIDIIYSVTKAPREIFADKTMKGVSGALDATRGGLKLISGAASGVSGIVMGSLDVMSFTSEVAKDRPNWALAWIYGGRGMAGIASAASGMITAYSYSGALFMRMASKTASRIGFYQLTFGIMKGAELANYLAQYRTLWLIRLARFNMIGLAFTALEIIYYCFIKDDELEDWMQACCFRKNKRGIFSGKRYKSEEEELDALNKAFEAIVQ